MTDRYIIEWPAPAPTCHTPNCTNQGINKIRLASGPLEGWYCSIHVEQRCDHLNSQPIVSSWGGILVPVTDNRIAEVPE